MTLGRNKGNLGTLIQLLFEVSLKLKDFVKVNCLILLFSFDSILGI